MKPNEYQELARRTLIEHPGTFTDEELMLVWNAIGLAGEAGELANLIKKGIFHRHGVDYEKLLDELGDILWYLSCLAEECSFGLEDIMQHNITKLRKRYPEGFTVQDSLVRKDLEK